MKPLRDPQRRASRKYFGREPGAGPAISLPVQQRGPLPREALHYFWHPDRPGSEHPPEDFARRLMAIHPDLALTKAPARAPVSIPCWILWYRKGSITHPLCPGWHLLMLWKWEAVPLPLDDRLFAAIYHFDARHCGTAVQYFDRVVGEQQRQEAKQRHAYDADLHDRSKDFFETTKIKNIGRGNKFALHHDGTVLPGRGELNWSLERERAMLPAEVREDRIKQKDRERSQ